jgi:integrase/recombinase XerC
LLKTSDLVECFLDDRRARNCSPETIAYYAWELRRLPDPIPRSPPELRHIIAHVAGSPITRHATFRAFRALYRFLDAEELLRPNPMERVAPPRLGRIRQRTLDRGDVARLHALALTDRDRALLVLLLDAGMRAGELANLRGRDLHEDWIASDGKSGQRDVLLAVKRLVADPDDHAFRAERAPHKPLSAAGISGVVHRALARAHLDWGKSGSHMLRHTFGRHRVASGGSLPALKEILGHRSIATTMVYVDLAGQEVRAQHLEHSQLARPQKIRRVV